MICNDCRGFSFFKGAVFGFFVGFQAITSHSKLLHQAMCVISITAQLTSRDRVLNTKAQFHSDVGVRCTIPLLLTICPKRKCQRCQEQKYQQQGAFQLIYPNISWEDPASNIKNDGIRHVVGIQTIQSRCLPLEIHHFESQQYLRVCPLRCLPKQAVGIENKLKQTRGHPFETCWNGTSSHLACYVHSHWFCRTSAWKEEIKSNEFVDTEIEQWILKLKYLWLTTKKYHHSCDHSNYIQLPLL